MADTLFSPKDYNINELANLFPGPDAVIIVKNWQEGIANGKVLIQKEEQLQDSFLQEFFGKLLGYPFETHLREYMLESESKTLADATKPDGALGYFSIRDGKKETDVRAVIELKDATVNLDKKQNRIDFKGSPVEQAFSYVPKMGGRCNWVIVSNFLEIRLYHASDITRYEQFMILDLLKEQNLSKLLYLLQFGRLFHKEGIGPTESRFLGRQQRQKTISNDFYREYKLIREELFYDIRKHNKDINPTTLFHATQKLIDRLIFTCFVQDLQIVDNVLKIVRDQPKNSFSQQTDLVWAELRNLFRAMDAGYARKNIPPFNGGLFIFDKVLDNLVIHDYAITGLIDFAMKYDFQSDLDVNILGHIFEQSITDIEGILARIQSENEANNDGEPSKLKSATASKRKKDGIFYTPAYITRYIVENSIGAWLDDRSKEILRSLEMETLTAPTPEDYQSIKMKSGKTVSANATILKHRDYWLQYQNALEKIKVLDPACGSGAFLTKSLDYLFGEWAILKNEMDKLHTTWEEKLKKNKGEIAGNGGLKLQSSTWDAWQVKKRIITENLFGVDINPASVEITRLSLWLKTANRTESLASLEGNIRLGNSLVDDPEIAGELAFDWHREFKPIMDTGGFDVVIGNPPYVPTELLSQGIKEFIKHKYPMVERKYDTSIIFTIKGLELINRKGYLGFISSITWQTGENYSTFRTFLSQNYGIDTIINLPFNIFGDAYVDTGIFIFKGLPVESYKIYNFDKKAKIIDINSLQFKIISLKELSENNFKIILNKPSKDLLARISFDNCVKLGEITASAQGLTASKFELHKKQQNGDFAFFKEGQIFRYGTFPYIIEFVNLNQFPTLLRFYEKGPKILIRRIISRDDRLIAGYSEDEMVFSKDVSPFLSIDEKYNPKYLLAIINSSLFSYLYLHISAIASKDDFRQTTLAELRALPIKIVSKKAQSRYTNKADTMLASNKELQNMSSQFLELLKADFKIEKLSKKLEHWYALGWGEFKDEIAKSKPATRLSGKAEENWNERFNRKREEAQKIINTLSETDKEIDRMVYELYGLTEEEIAIVERG
jgi:type I restriction-modification system DNA methylase subunit